MKKKELNRINFEDESGFTLMELIVVIGIIVILIALLVPRFSGMTDKANAASVQNDARIGLTALSAYVTSIDTQRNGVIVQNTARDEIYKALGAAVGNNGAIIPVPNITVSVTPDGQATITETRGGIAYAITIDARQGRITHTTCTGNTNACDALNNSGLLLGDTVTIN